MTFLDLNPYPSAARRIEIVYTNVVAGINHNIDELLVGVLSQINLRENSKYNKKNHNKVELFNMFAIDGFKKMPLAPTPSSA